MKRLVFNTLMCLGALCFVALATEDGTAQCSSCATPVVAYQPVISQPTVTYTPYNGWYPGKMLDRWRMRRYGYSEPVAVTAAYAPYTASYAPYSAGYVPYSASYAPYSYTSSYAPYTASYTPYTTNYVTAYAPLGQRQVLMRPVVVASPVVSSGCSTCAYSEPCSTCGGCSACGTSGCSACSSGVSSATYTEPACSSCAAGSSSTYGTTGGGLSAPSLTPQEAAPLQTRYPSEETSPSVTPGPVSDTNSYYDFEAPALVNPSDRTARRNVGRPIQRGPSVDVHNAIYVKPASVQSASVQQASAATVDGADGWSSLPSGR